VRHDHDSVLDRGMNAQSVSLMKIYRLEAENGSA